MVIDFMELNAIERKDQEQNFFDDESATSNSSVVNGDVGEANSNASNDDTLSDNVYTFNFGILKVNCAEGEPEEEVVESRTDVSADTGFVTRELFPVSGKTESCRSWSGDLIFVPQRQLKQLQKPSPKVKKGRRGPRSRSSEYRGVTFYRRTGRWESHIWDCGKQIYLGGFDTAHTAARAYDRAAIQFRGADADINFSLSDYEEDLKQMKHLSKVDFVHILRRQCNRSSGRNSKYHSVSLHDSGKLEAQMGQLLGKKAQEKTSIKCNGREALTNFKPNSYESEVIYSSQIEDNLHDLDLNLSISNNSSKETGNQRNVKYHPYDVLNRKIHKEIKTQERVGIGGSSNEPKKWAWQMQGQLIGTPISSAAAASSGFSSPPPVTTTTGLSASSHLSKSQICASLNLCFSAYRA